MVIRFTQKYYNLDWIYVNKYFILITPTTFANVRPTTTPTFHTTLRQVYGGAFFFMPNWRWAHRAHQERFSFDAQSYWLFWGGHTSVYVVNVVELETQNHFWLLWLISRKIHVPQRSWKTELFKSDWVLFIGKHQNFHSRIRNLIKSYELLEFNKEHISQRYQN